MAKKNELKNIAVEQLEIIDENPNEMKEAVYKHLKKTMQKRGGIQLSAANAIQ